MRDSLVDCQQHLITATLGSLQQFTILLAFEACPFHAVSLVAGKTTPEIHWKTLIQQNLQAILSSSDSFASSRAWTAISRVIVGN
jgi:hypothetical protein